MRTAEQRAVAIDPEQVRAEIGWRVMARRKHPALGKMSQQALADAVNELTGGDYTADRIGYIERGISAIPSDYLTAFAKALRTSVVYLIGDPDDEAVTVRDSEEVADLLFLPTAPPPAITGADAA